MKSFLKKNSNRILIVFVIASIVYSFLIGNKNNKDLTEAILQETFANINKEIVVQNNNKCILLSDSSSNYDIVYLGEGKGYNGKIKVLTICDQQQNIKEIQILLHSETHTYFQLIKEKNFLKKFPGINIRDIKNVDVISGATKSSKGIKQGIESAYYLAEGIPNKALKIKIGTLEITITLLFLLALLNSKIRNKKWIKTIWIFNPLISTLFLGFIYNSPLTTARINSFLIGAWPSIYTELAIYILVFGTLLLILFTGKNYYCYSICPFGSAQEIIGLMGKAKNNHSKLTKVLKKIQYAISFFVIVIALMNFNPAVTEYEIYGALFQLTANTVGFILLILIIISSLKIKRPWCNYLCPLAGVFKFTQLIRKEIKSRFL